MFAGTGRFRVYMRMFLPKTISPGGIREVSIILSRQSGMECLYDKYCPALAGIPVERTGIPLCQDGTKNVPANFFPYKRNGTNKYRINTENGGFKPDTSRGAANPEGCIWFEADVRGIYPAYLIVHEEVSKTIKMINSRDVYVYIFEFIISIVL